MSGSFYIYETQFKQTCWSCGHWVIGGGCFKDAENVRPTEHDHHCDDWVKEGALGTITRDEDAIHPSYYHTGNIDVIKYAEENFSKEERRGFYRMNVLKYVSRYHKKNGAEDLDKANFYLGKLKELENGKKSIGGVEI